MYNTAICSRAQISQQRLPVLLLFLLLDQRSGCCCSLFSKLCSGSSGNIPPCTETLPTPHRLCASEREGGVGHAADEPENQKAAIPARSLEEEDGVFNAPVLTFLFLQVVSQRPVLQHREALAHCKTEETPESVRLSLARNTKSTDERSRVRLNW